MKTNAILLLLSITFLWGCSKTDSDIPLEPSVFVDDNFSAERDNIGVTSGVLSFNSLKEFRAFYKFIFDNQLNVDFLLQYIKKNYGFVSAREIFENKINNIDQPTDFFKTAETNPIVFEKVFIGDEFYYELAMSNISSFFLNKDGKVIIGDTLIMARKEGTYLFAIKADKEFDINGLKSSNFRFVPNKNETLQLKSQFSYRIANFSNSRRIVARLYLHQIHYPGIGIMYEYDARTTAQYRVLGAWIQNRIDLIGLKHGNGTITHQWSGVTQVIPWNYLLSNRADLSVTLAYGSFVDPIIHSQSSLLLTHYGFWDSNHGYREIPNNELFQ